MLEPATVPNETKRRRAWMETQATRLLAALRAEVARLRRVGIPAGHTWSAVLVPLTWLSAPACSRRLLRRRLYTRWGAPWT